MEFGELLLEARLKSGLTLRQFAIVLGVTPVYISDLERKRRSSLSTEKILQLKNVPNISEEDIQGLLIAAANQRGEVQMPVPPNTNAQVALSGMARGGFTDDQWLRLRTFVEQLREED